MSSNLSTYTTHDLIVMAESNGSHPECSQVPTAAIVKECERRIATIEEANARIARLQAECVAWRAVSAHEHPAESRAERWKLKDARAAVDAHDDLGEQSDEPKTYTYGPFEAKTCRPEDIRPLGSGDHPAKEGSD